MTGFVLDASVAVKWFLPARDEPYSQQALALYEGYHRQELDFVVPDIFWAEIGSIFWKAIRQGRLEKVPAEEAIADLMKCELSSFASAALLAKAFEIATTFERSIYDSLYVSLAIQSNFQLITADERLANALAARFPIKWLGAI